MRLVGSPADELSPVRRWRAPPVQVRPPPQANAAAPPATASARAAGSAGAAARGASDSGTRAAPPRAIALRRRVSSYNGCGCGARASKGGIGHGYGGGVACGPELQAPQWQSLFEAMPLSWMRPVGSGSGAYGGRMRIICIVYTYMLCYECIMY
jgi:hypothetical protein